MKFHLNTTLSITADNQELSIFTFGGSIDTKNIPFKYLKLEINQIMKKHINEAFKELEKSKEQK